MERRVREELGQKAGLFVVKYVRAAAPQRSPRPKGLTSRSATSTSSAERTGRSGSAADRRCADKWPQVDARRTLYKCVYLVATRYRLHSPSKGWVLPMTPPSQPALLRLPPRRPQRAQPAQPLAEPAHRRLQSLRRARNASPRDPSWSRRARRAPNRRSRP
jgi:hypothetical protein